MRPPPSIARFVSFPVVAMISLAAMFVTGAVMFGKTEIEPFIMGSIAFETQPWRLASSALPHAGPIHLLFNVYWLWILGTIIEDELGHVSMLVLTIVLAAGSAAAQFAFSVGGIGLSGVGYGLVGFLWIARRTDARFRDAMDARTLQLFVAWGVLCIVLTVTNVLAIGNWAHGAGFLLGIPLAYAFLGRSLAHKLAGALLALILVAACLGAASLWRTRLNLSKDGGDNDFRIGTVELQAKDYDAAIRHLERAIEVSPSDDAAWYNYGVALQNAQGHLGMTKLDAFRKALALAPKEDQYRNAVANELFNQGVDAHEQNDNAAAEKLYRESISIKETGRAVWNLNIVLHEEDRNEEADQLAKRAREIDPDIAKSHPAPDEPADPSKDTPESIDKTGSGSAR
ncbi:MAG TPA: rhomboid family intramembrane serine protease [Kofleriaceae bacterium]|nr:rhomboid family intramembrane serine protease [Kofleriaceae bacterium]